MVLEAEDPPSSDSTVVIFNTNVSFAIWERLGQYSIAKRYWAEKDTWQSLLDSASALCPLAVVDDPKVPRTSRHRQS